MAKTGHPNFTLKFKSPWRGQTHQWSIASSHSGATFAAQADALAFIVGVYGVIASFFAETTSTFCSGYDYYDGQNSAALFSKEYATQTEATADGFTTGPFGAAYGTGASGFSGLETCVLLEAPVGLSKTGKPVTMKKFIHSVPAGAGNDAPPYANAPVPQNLAKQLGDGSLHDSRVLITASGKQGSWVPATYFSNHQMPRRSKKKTTSGGGALTDSLDALISAGKVVLSVTK